MLVVLVGRMAGKALAEVWPASRWVVQPVVAWWATRWNTLARQTVGSYESPIQSRREQNDIERLEMVQKQGESRLKGTLRA